jgi:hypothetical protein
MLILRFLIKYPPALGVDRRCRQGQLTSLCECRMRGRRTDIRIARYFGWWARVTEGQLGLENVDFTFSTKLETARRALYLRHWGSLDHSS